MKYEKWDENKIANAASKCKTKQEMKNLFPKEYAAAKRKGLLNTSMFSHMPKLIKNYEIYKWGKKENVLSEAAKYSNRKAFFDGNQSCYNAAKRKGWFEEACAHMPKNICVGNRPPTFKWDKKSVAEEALKYNTRSEFKNKSAGAYDAAIKNGWIDEVSLHMDVLIRKDLTLEKLKEIFSSCKNKKEALLKDPSAYTKVIRNGLQNIVFSHMPKRIDKTGENSPFYKGNDQEIIDIAAQYENKISFLTENPALYQRAYKRGILNEVCKNMKTGNDGSSFPEKQLFNIIKAIYPSSKKMRDMNVKIKNKPHIHGFDIDIFIPELNKGIEFDGTYMHSFEGLKRSRPNWPEEDVKNYHKLKDRWFKSKGIKIIHIKERDWKSNKDFCIKKCFDFLME